MGLRGSESEQHEAQQQRTREKQKRGKERESHPSHRLSLALSLSSLAAASHQSASLVVGGYCLGEVPSAAIAPLNSRGHVVARRLLER